jgi:hypothetical protein
MSDREKATSASVPTIGLWVPTAAIHVLFFVVSVGLCILVLPAPLWLSIGLSLAVAGALAPNTVPTWWLLLLLGVSQLSRDPSATDTVYYLLLAGLHLLHVVGSFARVVPWSGRMQIAGVVRPLQRFVLVQAVVQPFAFVALLLFGEIRGSIPGLSIVAAVTLATVAAVLFRGRRAAKTVS